MIQNRPSPLYPVTRMTLNSTYIATPSSTGRIQMPHWEWEYFNRGLNALLYHSNSLSPTEQSKAFFFIVLVRACQYFINTLNYQIPVSASFHSTSFPYKLFTNYVFT